MGGPKAAGQGGSRVRSQAGAVCQVLEQAKQKKQLSRELCAAFQALYPEEEDEQSQTENSSKNSRMATQMQQRDGLTLLEDWISFL